ncbi:unnamed protein product [Ilex paraguariensis]|uniref:C2H2-type domain-containing protein n=1 Tax=Ilex paraguariensis TaxID=185542 RepID=A0ABC8R7G8_9AQUA
MEKVNLNRDKFKDTWDSTNYSFERDRTYGFSWPQRNYKCSFCKKEFKSAQALGGHMNIHRRDRARLRQSPSWDCPNNPNPSPNPSPSPNPNFSSSSHAARFLPYMAYSSSLTPSLTSFSSPSLASMDEEKMPLIAVSQHHPIRPHDKNINKKPSKGAFVGVGELTGFSEENDYRVWKKREIVSLDLEMGLLPNGKEDLDLELRLGNS